MELTSWLPRHLARILPSEIGQMTVDESQLDCLNCVQGDAKCCTFWPFIPNFEVHRVLQEFEGKERLSILSQTLPIGIVAPHAFQAKHRETSHRAGLRCPYLSDEGRCRIWKIRPAECATYFCRSQAGEQGMQFWREVNQLTHFIEFGLAQQWMIEAGYRWSEVATNLEFIVLDQGEKPNAAKVPRWAHHADSIEVYFERAWQWAEELSREDVSKLLGASHERLLAKVKSVHALTSWAMSPTGKE